MPKRPVCYNPADGVKVTFDSIKRASAWFNIDESSIRKSIKRDHRCIGWKWRYDD